MNNIELILLLTELNYKIESNTAVLDDYEKLQILLIELGKVDKDFFIKILQQFNINSFSHLIEVRNEIAIGLKKYDKHYLEWRKEIEGGIIVKLRARILNLILDLKTEIRVAEVIDKLLIKNDNHEK